MLNHAASVALRTLAALAAAGLLFVASAASALDGIDLSVPAEPVAEGECPRLVQIKYPFLSCVDGQIGLSDENDTWENSRQLPMQGLWTEGDGAYGPDLNQN